MDPIQSREPRVLWSFWIACGLAATGGLLPFLLAIGGTNRIAGAAIPFAVAAMAFAAAALLYERGRPLTTALYFIAGLALVYGMLYMLVVPLRLAVVGTCGPDPSICGPGLERPMSGGEDGGLAIGITTGMLAILVGYFGLLTLFRSRRQPAPVPPVRRERTPWVPKPAEPEPAAAHAEPEPAAVTTSTQSASHEPEPHAPAAVAAPPKPARKPRVKRAPQPTQQAPELAAPIEPLELAPPEERLELPAPQPASDTKSEADTAS
jgi:hypothetical protein